MRPLFREQVPTVGIVGNSDRIHTGMAFDQAVDRFGVEDRREPNRSKCLQSRCESKQRNS
jgi:hypothetical protein